MIGLDRIGPDRLAVAKPDPHQLARVLRVAHQVALRHNIAALTP